MNEPMRVFTVSCFVLTLLLMQPVFVSAKGPVTQKGAVQKGTEAHMAPNTISTARFNAIRDRYVKTKSDYDKARAAAGGEDNPADLREKAAAYQEAYQAYIEACRKQRID